jgi:hypothetical protein
MADTLLHAISMPTARFQPDQNDTRRAGISGLGAMSLLLAAVIVLTSTPATLAGQLSDPAHPISRVGSQLRRIAAAMPARIASKKAKKDTYVPQAVIFSARAVESGLLSRFSPSGMLESGAVLAGLPFHCIDLPPPALKL